ncbi:MAG: glycoside hydrolase family 3 N-terminal domain-containing protein [Pseudonocardiaceae bacterium]
MVVLVVCSAVIILGALALRGDRRSPAPRSVRTVACSQESAIAQLPLRRRLAQLMIVGVDAGGPQQALAVVRSDQVGGLFLTGSATGLLSDGALQQVQDAAAVPLAVAVDDEGGRVQRIDALDGPLPSARWMAAHLTVEQVYELARKRGGQLRARGVTVDFAPILDVSSQPDDAVIGDRSFSSDPNTVTRYAGAFASGLRDAGVLPVFKHFPGHGRATGDSHRSSVRTPPLAELRDVDLVPYRRLLDGQPAAVMVGHLDVPGLTEPNTPASLSPAALALLRDQFGFDGLVITDDLAAMAAITDRADLAEAVRRALAAGADMALSITANRLPEVLDHLEQAVATGSLPEPRVNAAVAHVLATKAVNLCSAASPHSAGSAG